MVLDPYLIYNCKDTQRDLYTYLFISFEHILLDVR